MNALPILREMERSARLTVREMFRTRHDGMFDLAIKIDVIRENRKRAEALRTARRYMGDGSAVDLDDIEVYRDCERVVFGNQRWGRAYTP